MEELDNFSLSTWGSLWKFIGIEAHSKYGYYYINAAFKAEDVVDDIEYEKTVDKTEDVIISDKIGYIRIDGKVPVEKRQDLVNKFQNEEIPLIPFNFKKYI